MSVSGLPVCNALWVGTPLSGIAAACLASFVRHGHRVVLHTYDPPRQVPAGVALADAAKTIPSSRVFRHKATGSYALFSDLFRYELLRRDQGLWIDCDVYCLRPLAIDPQYVYGWEAPGSINGAVLGLPSAAPVVRSLIELFTMRTPVFPWLPEKDRMALQARQAAGETLTLADLPWGAAGPLALTYLIRKAGLVERTAARDVFYPLHWRYRPLLLRAETDLTRVVTRRTLTMHLWNDVLSRHLDKTQPGSPIDRLLSKGTLFDETRLVPA